MSINCWHSPISRKPVCKKIDGYSGGPRVCVVAATIHSRLSTTPSNNKNSQQAVLLFTGMYGQKKDGMGGRHPSPAHLSGATSLVVSLGLLNGRPLRFCGTSKDTHARTHARTHRHKCTCTHTEVVERINDRRRCSERTNERTNAGSSNTGRKERCLHHAKVPRWWVVPR